MLSKKVAMGLCKVYMISGAFGGLIQARQQNASQRMSNTVVHALTSINLMHQVQLTFTFSVNLMFTKFGAQALLAVPRLESRRVLAMDP